MAICRNVTDQPFQDPELIMAPRDGDVRNGGSRRLAACRGPANTDGGLGDVQLRRVGQDPLTELGELRTGIQPQLVAQQRAELVVDSKSFRCASGSMQGEHELCSGSLTERILSNERLQTRQRIQMPAGGEERLEESSCAPRWSSVTRAINA